MLRYQASMYSDPYGTDYHSPVQGPSTIASSMGLRSQQGRVIKRPTTTFKSIPACRLAPRRRLYVADSNQKSMTSSNGITFPPPDYAKRMKENYESGKIIYIRRNGSGTKGSQLSNRLSTINASIRAPSYHAPTLSAGSVTLDTSGRYVYRLPKPDFGSKFDENRPNSNTYVPAHEPPKQHYTTVPASMSMGGEVEYEEEVDDEIADLGADELTGDGFNADKTPKSESPDPYLKSSGPLIQSSPINNTPKTTPNSYNLLQKNRIPASRFSCPQQDCYWRGANEMSMKKHMQVHGPKQPVMYNKSGETMKVQLVQPKPKGVKCSECETFAYSRPLLLRHMYDSHGIEAPLVKRTFANREMLQAWLDSLRETHAVEFVVSSGSKKWGRGLQVHYLTCSRSGDQKERPNKKYVRPPRPSIKCGRNCMAYLKIKQNPTVSELQIEGCLHHSGHEIDHTRMLLEANELSCIGAIVDAVNEGLEVLGNVETVRSYLGSSGRFRLVSDNGLIEQMPVWFEQYHREVASYGGTAAYRGSGALTLTNSYLPTMKQPMHMNRRMPYGSMNIKKELDSITIKTAVPIRFNGGQLQNIGMSPENQDYDESKVKIEMEDEDTLATQSLLKDEFEDLKSEDLFGLGGEDDEILCGGEEASGVTSNIDGILAANLPDNFNDPLCGMDLSTDFSCGLDDDLFDDLLGLPNFNDRNGLNCS